MAAFKKYTLELIPLFFLIIYLVHGSFSGLGMTDDEAYYWVLAQHPAWGYSYHPPMVAWLIALSQWLFGGILGENHPFIVRFPSALLSAGIVYLGLRWQWMAGVRREDLWKGGLILASFVGFSAVSWMMVPDLPLFFGMLLLINGLWEGTEKNSHWKGIALSGLGMAIAMASKISAVLMGGSAFLWIVFGLSDNKIRWRYLLVLGLGAAIGFIPSIVWNYQNEWAAFIYQLKERHQSGGSLSLLRWGQFWATQLILVGPVAVGFLFLLLIEGVRKTQRWTLYLACWVFPSALVFFIQPLFSPFKIHWAFVAWFPALLGLGLAWAQGRIHRLAWIQSCFGVFLAIFVLLSCHFYWVGPLVEKVKGELNPLWDVTNDMYGWKELPAFLEQQDPQKVEGLAVVGSWYQTASQASFYLHGKRRVTKLPRDRKEWGEWPDFDLARKPGPHWYNLKEPVIYVADNRYTNEPVYADGKCEILGKIEGKRWDRVVKVITVWRCEPPHS